MTSSNTASKKAPLSPPLLPASKNPIPGPAEIAAAKVKPPPKTNYTPPSGRAKRLPEPSRNIHPLLKNPGERRNEILEITPERAYEILEKWNRRNRPFKPTACARYQEDMVAGRFMGDNGECVSFDWNGDLIDGQNRLTAIVRSGKTYLLLVASGLDPDARRTVDIGISRTLADVLGMNGVACAAIVGRAARLLIVYENGGLDLRYREIHPEYQPSKAEIQEYIDQHGEELTEAVKMAMNPVYRNPWIKAAGVSTFCIALFRRQLPDLARTFMYQFAKGTNPQDGTGLNDGHPILLLRNVLIRNQGARRLPMTHLVAFILKAWIAVRDHKSIKQLSVSEREHFPDLDLNWPPAQEAKL